MDEPKPKTLNLVNLVNPVGDLKGLSPKERAHLVRSVYRDKALMEASSVVSAAWHRFATWLGIGAGGFLISVFSIGVELLGLLPDGLYLVTSLLVITGGVIVWLTALPIFFLFVKWLLAIRSRHVAFRAHMHSRDIPFSSADTRP